MTESEKKDYKDVIINQLTEIMKDRKNNGDIWKVRAYKKVIDLLKIHDKPIYNLENVNDIEGIGKGIKDKIEEIFDHNIILEIKNRPQEDKNKNNIIEILTKISGIGVKKAEDLYDNHNIQSIEDLQNKQELLNDVQKIGFKYYKDEGKRIPAIEIQKHEKFIKDIIKSYNSNIICNIAGSYRRKAKDSGDIDVLITNPNNDIESEELFKNIVDMMIKKKYIKDTLAYGKKKCMGYCKLYRHKTFRRIDILYSEPDRYAFALLYFTGNQQFNIKLRNLALSKGLSLSEYGLTYTSGINKGNYVEGIFLREEDIFKFLGLKYINPENRQNDINLLNFTL
jgi:DNA polymerase/3'-5' exonuclease PolX